jgi:hypothetical protein
MDAEWTAMSLLCSRGSAKYIQKENSTYGGPKTRNPRPALKFWRDIADKRNDIGPFSFDPATGAATMSIQAIGSASPKLRTNDVPAVPSKSQALAGKGEKAEKKQDVGQPKERGVIRLLQDGHFKGVADLRLRINFADELAAVENATRVAALGHAGPGLLEDVNAAVDDFVAGLELTEDQGAAVDTARATLNEALNTVIAESQESGVLDVSALVDRIQGAFDDFFTSLDTVLAPVEEPASLQAAEEPIIEASAPAPTDGLRDAFASILSQLQDSLSESMLPPLSEASGNGAAYDKFLAIYNEMRGLGTAGETVEPETPIDTVI